MKPIVSYGLIVATAKMRERTIGWSCKQGNKAALRTMFGKELWEERLAHGTETFSAFKTMTLPEKLQASSKNKSVSI